MSPICGLPRRSEAGQWDGERRGREGLPVWAIPPGLFAFIVLVFLPDDLEEAMEPT